MGKKGIVGSILTLIGGFFLGYASGITATINYAINGVRTITIDLFDALPFGLGSSIGREIGDGIRTELQRYMMAQIGNQIGGLMLIGALLALIGIIISLVTKEGTSIKKEKKTKSAKVTRKIVVQPGTTTVKCPICQFPLDITGQTDGTCPQCKNDVEIMFQG